MKEFEITINNETGLHARPAKTLVNLVKQFKSSVVIWHKGKKANAKSSGFSVDIGGNQRKPVKD